VTSEHTDVAAYALGLLEPGDRQEFEEHLAGCGACTAELAEFAQMHSLLAGVEPAGPGGDGTAEAGIASLLRRRERARRRRMRWQAGLAAAAAVVLLAVGVTAGLLTAPGAAPPGTLTQVVGVRHAATDPVTGVAATVGLATRAWGTQITLDLAKIHGPQQCQLIAVSRTGGRRVVTGWFVPPAGYGVPGHPGHLIVEGGTAIPAGELSRLIVIAASGRALVTIPV
jgi:putative zinc finger protein